MARGNARQAALGLLAETFAQQDALGLGQLGNERARGLAVAQAAVSGAIRTRGGPAGANLPQCLVTTEGVCVDD